MTNHNRASLEEGLQDWLIKSGVHSSNSSTSSCLLEICRCCNQSDCENLDAISSIIRKLETESRLAAEIGQSLLYKHEQFVIESNIVKTQLEIEVNKLRERVRDLETSLSESDNIKQDLISEKDKSIWECQKTQKILNETVADLESRHDECCQLNKELKSTMTELDKLRIFKFMARQADIREDALRAKLEDLKQELALARKAELSMESKYKKLNTKYESLVFLCERLKVDQQDIASQQVDLMWLKESNERLRKDVLKLTVPSTSQEMMTNLIELIKELASANHKLKQDLLDCTDLLMECKRYNQQEEDEELEEEDVNQSTIIHHHKHYHYYIKNRLSQTKRPSIVSEKKVTIAINAEECDHVNQDTSSPFGQLYNQVTNVFSRLQQTDIRALNRKLKRAFDILELSNMSNSIIENIVIEVDGLFHRFIWIEKEVKHPWTNDVSIKEFFPILTLLQNMLKEIGQLRTTMNELQVDYFKKIEENDLKLEKELLKKQQQCTQQKMTFSNWFSNVFNTNIAPVKKKHNQASIFVDEPTSIHPEQERVEKIAIIKRKKSDLLLRGPHNSFPTRSSPTTMTNTPKRRTSAANPQPNAAPLTIRASQSAGTVRRSKSMQAPALVVKRKRSILGLNENEFSTSAWLGK